jgi:transcription initiation factor TFIIIB Brf1 subunit/transcription initiation factor TFIIB
MSKQLTALLLQKSISDKSIQDQKKHLIECLKKQGLISEPDVVPIEPIVMPDICDLCESSDIIYSNHEMICNECGIAKSSIRLNPFKTFKQDINFGTGTFLEPGLVVVSIIKDGKTVSRDLSKINTWVAVDAEDQRIANGLRNLAEILDKIRQYYNPISFERVEKEIISMWYNVLISNKNIMGKEKRALLAWTIYYPMVYNNLSVSIQRISSITDTFIGDIYSYNFRLKDLFKGTSFEKYISVPIGTNSDLNLPQKIQDKMKNIRRDMKDYLKDPLKDKQLYGLIYFISKNTPDKFFTLADLATKSSISTVTILNESKKYEQFYKTQSLLRKRLFD